LDKYVNKINVQIIQPVVPHYRVPLFRKLIEDDRFEIIIDASPHFNGVNSSKNAIFANLAHKCIQFFGGMFYWQSGISVSKKLEYNGVLIINGNPRVLSNYLLLIQARLRKIPVIDWNHGWSPTSTKFRSKIRRLLMRSVDYHLLYTDAEVNNYIDIGYTKSQCYSANNTINLSDIDKCASKTSANDIEKFKKRNLLKDKRVLLFSGRLRNNPSTNLLVLINALKHLVRLNDCYRLIIIGDGEEKDNLLNESTQLGLDDYIIWLGEVYDEESLAPWFLVADCFVYPGAIGLSIMHAFGYGLPVITHDKIEEHNPEISALKNHYNGVFFKKGDVSSLVEKIEKYFSEPNEMSNMKKHSYDTIRGEYSFDGMVNRVSNVIILAANEYAQ